jgi:hypothetical protein
MRASRLGVLAVAAFAMTTACKDKKMVHAQTSVTNLRADMQRARTAAQRAVDGFVPKVLELAGPAAAPLTNNDPVALRSTLVGFTTPGGPMTLYPTSFVAVTGRDGLALARDLPNESDDRMKGMDLRAPFACVRAALEGRQGMCVGELPAVQNVPSRVLLVAVAPVKNAAGETIGSISAGLTFGVLSRMIDTAVRGNVGDSVFWTGLRYRDRVLPAGTDQDVAPRWRVPQSLVRTIPAVDAMRIEQAGGEHFYPFEQDGRGWGGAIGSLPFLPGALLVLFRSEASQR